MEKNHHALDTGGRDVRMGSDLGLERFHAQPKWVKFTKGCVVLEKVKA